MQAQRKITPSRGASPDTAAVDEGWMPRPAASASELTRSSATHLMLRELDARLRSDGTAADPAAAVVSNKWPMPIRLATVVGLGAACWGVIYFAVAAVL